MSAFFRIVSVGGRQWWVVRSHELKEACHSVFCGQSAVDSIDAITDSAMSLALGTAFTAGYKSTSLRTVTRSITVH